MPVLASGTSFQGYSVGSLGLALFRVEADCSWLVGAGVQQHMWSLGFPLYGNNHVNEVFKSIVNIIE